LAWEQRIRFAFLLVHFIVCLLRMLGYFNKLFTDPILIFIVSNNGFVLLYNYNFFFLKNVFFFQEQVFYCCAV